MSDQLHYPTIAEIQAVVTQHFGLRRLDMISAQRSRRIARPRQIAMALAAELTPLSLPTIGRLFGNRDHTTVMHAVKRIKELNESDIEVAYDLAAIRDAIADPNQLPLPLA